MDIFSLLSTDIPALDGVPLVGYGTPTLLALFIIAVLRGDLVPRKVHDDVKTERDALRGALKDSEDARLLKDKQLEVVKEIGLAVQGISRGIDAALRDDGR